MPPSSTLSDATGALLVGLTMERDRLAEMRARIIDRRR